jgi:histidinol-phosphate aminotransferase
MFTQNPHVADYIKSLVPYVPGKPIEETQREYKIKKVIKLASNENPLGPSPKALRAIQNVLKDLHRYPDASAFGLKKTIAENLKTAPESLILGNGSNEVIDFLIRTFCTTGDAIATSQAAFLAYRICAQIHGVSTLEAPLTRDFRFDLPAILKLTSENPKVRMVFIANPNNPTGTYVNQAEMESFLNGLAKVRGGSVLAVLDYAYWEYVTASDLPDPMALQKKFPNVVILRTFSKIYGLAGLRLGYGVAAPELVAPMEKVRQPFNLNSLALVAGIAAMSDRTFVERARKLNIQGRKYWETQLDALKIPYWKSQGNFLLADVSRGLGMRGAEVYEACLRKGVIFRPVTNYGLPHALRISFGKPEENRISVKVLKELRAQTKK